MKIGRRLLALAATATLAVTGFVGARTAGAAPTGYHVDAVIPIDEPVGIAAGYGAVWVLSGFEQQSYSYLERVDPMTNTVTASYPVGGSAGGGPAIGFGSIWVSLYDANKVVRIDARTGTVQARINVGLQPEVLHVAFGSVWSADHHGQRVSRIDPTTNKVVANPVVGANHAFRGGPQDITDDGHVLYASASVDMSLNTIDPATSRVVDRWRTPDDVFCGDLVAVAGTVWSVDHCTNVLFQLDPTNRNRSEFFYGDGAINSATYFKHLLWTSFDRDGQNFTGGVLQARNAANGAVRATFDIGGDASVVRDLLGSLWVLDQTNGTVSRISLTQPADRHL